MKNTKNRIKYGKVIDVIPLKYKVVKTEDGEIHNFINLSINGLGPEFKIGTNVVLEYRRGPQYGLWFAKLLNED